MYASQNGHFEILQKLINRDANVNLTSQNGSTALMWAIRSGHEKTAGLLLASGADLHSSENEFKMSPLLLSAKYGRNGILKDLLFSGSDINAVDKHGANALIKALSYNHFETALFLIEGGISVNIPNQNKLTPLMISSSKGNFELTDLLIEKGAKVNVMDKSGKTALMYAAAEGNTNIVKLLLREKSRLDFRDRFGMTAWMHAVENKNIPVVEFLSKKEIDNNENLFYAVSNGHYEAVKILLELQANPEARDEQGWTLLMLAANNGHKKIVEHLIKSGAKINHINELNKNEPG
jgi:FOG: Ankyrin repeat